MIVLAITWLLIGFVVSGFIALAVGALIAAVNEEAMPTPRPYREVQR